ncbi:MAG: mannitol dehydrogenase family protein [Bacteroidetes bacterium]|nr:mannitol dehydrogenase family protein [Fibrella sp.]
MQPSAKNLKTGIAHIGVGNFHRAHQAYYVHQYGQQTSDKAWGICGIALLENDRPIIDALKRQQGTYTLTTFDEKGQTESTRIESIVELLFAPDESESVIEKLSSPDVKIVTLTITEAGYNIDLATGGFKSDSPHIQHDVQHPDQPRTVFGYLTAALERRFQNGVAPFTVLSCDNFPHNGDAARTAFVSFAALRNPTLAAQIAESVSFPNSMVDRITPSVSPAQKGRLNELAGWADEVPVFSEPFIQWVVEDRFGNGRPALERVGVQFTDDVSAYEAIKLRLLNASHSMLAYPAFLAGYTTVDEAIGDPVLHDFIQKFMDEDVTPILNVLTTIDLADYKATLLRRFANKSIGDQLARLCFDGASKLPIYVLPTLNERMARNLPYQRIAFLIAAYGHYLSADHTERGDSYTVAEPQLDAQALATGKNADRSAFLNLSLFNSTSVRNSLEFIRLYTQFRADIVSDGILKTLKKIG